MVYRRKKGKKNTNAKPLKLDGIDFKSKLEAETYQALKKNNIKASYESVKYTLIDGFEEEVDFYIKNRGSFKAISKKVRPITYTPDFVDDYDSGDYGFVIEVKGRRNEAYPMRIKLFRKWRLENSYNKDFFEVSNIDEVNKAIAVIKEKL